MAGAAFFDLDRTLLQGGTGPILSRAMYELGVVSRRLPGEAALFKVFAIVGETLPSIFLARQATLVAKGREEATFDEAAVAAAEEIEKVVHPFARTMIEHHKDAGRPVVLATTTPKHLIGPLAARLGFDDVIATRYGVDADGKFDGSLRGPFVWSRGKLVAVKHWASARGIDLAESYAYSDSIYDTPLLHGVGHPAAVNPDPRLTAYAILQRGPIVPSDVSPGVAKVPILGIELQTVAVQTAFRPELYPYARFDIKGVENIPRVGPGILVANHRSYFDLVAMAQVVRTSGRTARYLGKKEIFDTPIIGPLMAAMGGIRVDRDGAAMDSFDNAEIALAGGELVGLMPQGTIPRGQAFFDPVLRGKTGAARLAAATRAPVIPVGIWGTEQVWPRSSSMPDMTSVLHPKKIRIRVGAPVELRYRSASADTRRIMDAVADLLPPEARERREPPEAELRTSYPTGRLPGEE
jgi:putative phosphoserine phosphatase/1-acylglycerol-3-phosphate O-acyltransferase